MRRNRRDQGTRSRPRPGCGVAVVRAGVPVPRASNGMSIARRRSVAPVSAGPAATTLPLLRRQEGSATRRMASGGIHGSDTSLLGSRVPNPDIPHTGLCPSTSTFAFRDWLNPCLRGTASGRNQECLPRTQDVAPLRCRGDSPAPSGATAAARGRVLVLPYGLGKILARHRLRHPEAKPKDLAPG